MRDKLCRRWKEPAKKDRFPEDIVFVEGDGVSMEEHKKNTRRTGHQNPVDQNTRKIYKGDSILLREDPKET